MYYFSNFHNSRKQKILQSLVLRKRNDKIDFIFLGSKITVDGDCSHEIKGCLLLGRIAMTNLDSILKSRDITWPTKVWIVKLWFFHQRIWELTIKKSGWLKYWCFQTVMLEKTLESLLNSKGIKSINPKGNQPWIFIERIGAEPEGISNTLATWCKQPTHWRRPCCWKKIEGRRREQQRMDGIIDSMDINLSELRDNEG